MIVKELPCEVLSRVRMYKLYCKSTHLWKGNVAINLAHVSQVKLNDSTISFQFTNRDTQTIEYHDNLYAEKEYYSIHHVMNK
jgi:hypothetical protein